MTEEELNLEIDRALALLLSLGYIREVLVSGQIGYAATDEGIAFWLQEQGGLN